MPIYPRGRKGGFYLWADGEDWGGERKYPIYCVPFQVQEIPQISKYFLLKNSFYTLLNRPDYYFFEKDKCLMGDSLFLSELKRCDWA